jgi:hypothetical protein
MLVPAGLTNKISSTFKELPQRKKYQTKRIRFSSMAAALLICVLMALGFASPGFATTMPLLNNVFEFLHSKNLVGDEYSKYSSAINQTQTDKGITVTINQVLYDGINISVGYVVNSKQKIENPYLINKVVKINGVEKSFASGGSSFPKDDHTVAVIQDLELGEKILPKDFNMQLKINEIDGMPGVWSFKFRVSQDSTKAQIQEVAVGKDLSLIRDGLSLDEMILTPITTAFRFSGKIDDSRVEYMLFDDRGNQIQANGISISGKNGKTFEQYQFAPLEQPSKYLKLIPYQVKSVKAGEEVYIKQNLGSEFPMVFPRAGMGDLVVENIANSVEKTEIRFKVGDLTPSSLTEYMFIEDGVGKRISINRFNSNPVSGKPNEFIAQIQPLRKNEKYSIGIEDLRNRLQILEDPKIVIPIEK